MARTKDISDFFEIDILTIRPGAALLFDVHLYFPKNSHLVKWKSQGDLIPQHSLDEYLQKGINRVWVHTDDRAAFEEYCNPTSTPAHVPIETVEKLPSPPNQNREPRTLEGAFMAAVIESAELDIAQKKTILTEAAQQMIQDASQAQTAAEQARANIQLRRTIQDVLDSVAKDALSVVHEIWKLCEIDPDLAHAVNVATFAVIFALAFGRIDADLIADIALAGLLHDIGISQVDLSITALPWKSMQASEHREYVKHVDHSMHLIEQMGTGLSQRVRTIVHQHHEKFDGTGYPRGLQGFRVDDVAQLLGMADLLDSIASGHWDGTERTLGETFKVLEKIEKVKTFPEYFNPEVFAAVMRWIRGNSDENSMQGAIAAVGKQAKRITSKTG